eukprot:scpid90691/ scgid8463/ 
MRNSRTIKHTHTHTTTTRRRKKISQTARQKSMQLYYRDYSLEAVDTLSSTRITKSMYTHVCIADAVSSLQEQLYHRCLTSIMKIYATHCYLDMYQCMHCGS